MDARSARHRAVVAFSSAIALLGYSASVAAQGPAPASGTPAILKRPLAFNATASPITILNEFHRASGLNILADDLPGTSEVDVRSSGTVKDGISALAERLDCRWSVTPAGIAVLSRRFTNPDTFPQANLEELRQTAKDVVRGLRALNYGPSDALWAPMLKSLAQSLTPAQVEFLQAKKRLDSRDLGAAQREILQQAILTRAFGGPRAAWEMLAARLDHIEKSRVSAQEMPGGSPGAERRFALVFTSPEGLGLPPALLGVVDSVVSGEAAMLARRDGSVGGGHDAAKDRAPQSPITSGSANGLATLVSPTAGSQTLAETLGALSSQTGKTIAPQSCLRDRRIMVYVEKAPARDVLNALDALYGWRWVESQTGEVNVARNLPRLPQRPSQMGAYMRAALPADFRTFYGLPDDTGGADSASGGIQPSIPGRTRAITGRANALLHRALAERKALTGSVSYDQLSPTAAAALRLMLFSQAFRDADEELWRDLPGPHRMDALDAEIELQQGNILMVWPRAHGTDMAGFGANVAR